MAKVPTLIPPTGIRKASTTSTKQILVVDDHELLRAGMRVIERQSDLAVCAEAADQSAAIAHFRRLRPDLVIAEFRLKAGNAVDLIRRLKAIDPRVKVIIYSTHDDQVYAERALRAGAMGYVNKQRPADAVLKAARHVLAGKLYFSEEVTQRFLGSAASIVPVANESSLDHLSDREFETFELLGRGLTSRLTATRLHLSPRTVDTYRERLKAKLCVANAAELHFRAVQWAVEGLPCGAKNKRD